MALSLSVWFCDPLLCPEEKPVTHRSRRLRATLVSLSLLSVSLMAAGPAAAAHNGPLGNYKHLVVIYEENHSFDNLYGTWGTVGGRQVDGLAQATAQQRTQVAQDGTPFGCLLQDDVNLTSPPLPSSCSDAAHGIGASAFAN